MDRYRENERSGVRVQAPEEGPAKILQITPAGEGWRAVLEDEESGKHFTYPVLCWALVRHVHDDEEQGDQWVETYVAPVVPDSRVNEPSGTTIISKCSNYVGLAAPGQDPKEVLDHYRLHVAKEREEEERLAAEEAEGGGLDPTGAH